MLEFGERRLSRDDVADLLATDHPMVERFCLEVQQAVRGESVHFAIVIVPRPGVRYCQQRGARGERVAPAWHTLTGKEDIGQGNRALWMEGAQLAAENQTFFPNQCFNDLGIGTAMYVAQERLYRALGVRRVNLLAVAVGTYTWARQGFAFEDAGMAASLTQRLERFLFGHGLPLSAVSPEALRESWNFANYDAQGLTIDSYRAGKAFMLDAVPAWHGVKYLDDPTQTSITEQSRRETFARLPEKIEGAAPELRVR
jgi:hypothetical protein